VYSNTFKELLY